MLDSVNFRVNNIHKYPLFLHYLLNNSKTKIHEAFAKIEPNKNALWFKLRMQQFEIEGEKHLSVRGEKVTSSHYNLGWSIPLGDNCDYVEFNFSIPKLLYGTNIIQFVQHSSENAELWDFEHGKSFKWNAKNTFRRFRKFMKHFFIKAFDYTGEKIYFEDIEIRRFDLCWNQIFNSKDHAFEYLGYQKEIKKKFTRENKKGKHGWDESVFFSTRDYGVKIYHKGSEYKSSKGEKKKHKEINRLEHRKVFDTDVLQEFADRILRYEITFRSAYISKIFRNKVFRKDSETWKKRMKKFRRVRRVESYMNSSTLSQEKRDLYYRIWTGEKVEGHKEITKEDKKFYEFWKLVKERRVGFYMKCSDNINQLNKSVTLDEIVNKNTYYEKKSDYYSNVPEVAEFSEELLAECFKIFDTFRKHFRVRETAYISTSAKKVKVYNEGVKNFNEYHDKEIKDGHISPQAPLNIKKVRQIIFLLQSHSLDYLVKHNMVSRTTAWRYEKMFKAVDLNMRGGSEIEIPCCNGFEWYHQALVHDNLSRYLRNEIFF